MLNKFLFVVSFAVLTLLNGIAREEARMPWREWLWSNKEFKVWNEHEKREYRKKEYKMMLIFWAVMVLAAVIYVIFFVD